MTNIFSDRYTTSEKIRYFAPRVLVSFIAITALGRACGNDTDNQSTSIPPTEDTVFDGTIYLEESGAWKIECVGEQDVPLYSGSTFSAIVGENVEVVNPNGLGQRDLPLMAVVEASAEVAGVADPDIVQADQTYKLPLSCMPDVAG